jgi:hypothetical protein
MFLTGLVMVLSKSSRDEIILTTNNHTVLLGLISLLVGLPIIILHNIWVGPWEIVVTLMGWLTVLKGFVRMLNNPKMNKLREKSMSDFSGGAAGTSAPNIGDNIDVYNLYDQSGSKLAKIYLHGYQSFTSSKAPKGFVLDSDISDEQDAVKVMEKLENLSEDEKQKLGQDVIDKMNKES